MLQNANVVRHNICRQWLGNAPEMESIQRFIFDRFDYLWKAQVHGLPRFSRKAGGPTGSCHCSPQWRMAFTTPDLVLQLN